MANDRASLAEEFRQLPDLSFLRFNRDQIRQFASSVADASIRADIVDFGDWSARLATVTMPLVYGWVARLIQSDEAPNAWPERWREHQAATGSLRPGEPTAGLIAEAARPTQAELNASMDYLAEQLAALGRIAEQTEMFAFGLPGLRDPSEYRTEIWTAYQEFNRHRQQLAWLGGDMDAEAVGSRNAERLRAAAALVPDAEYLDDLGYRARRAGQHHAADGVERLAELTFSTLVLPPPGAASGQGAPAPGKPVASMEWRLDPSEYETVEAEIAAVAAYVAGLSAQEPPLNEIVDGRDFGLFLARSRGITQQLSTVGAAAESAAQVESALPDAGQDRDYSDRPDLLVCQPEFRAHVLAIEATLPDPELALELRRQALRASTSENDSYLAAESRFHARQLAIFAAETPSSVGWSEPSRTTHNLPDVEVRIDPHGWPESLRYLRPSASGEPSERNLTSTEVATAVKAVCDYVLGSEVPTRLRPRTDTSTEGYRAQYFERYVRPLEVSTPEWSVLRSPEQASQESPRPFDAARAFFFKAEPTPDAGFDGPYAVVSDLCGQFLDANESLIRTAKRAVAEIKNTDDSYSERQSAEKHNPDLKAFVEFITNVERIAGRSAASKKSPIDPYGHLLGGPGGPGRRSRLIDVGSSTYQRQAAVRRAREMLTNPVRVALSYADRHDSSWSDPRASHVSKLALQADIPYRWGNEEVIEPESTIEPGPEPTPAPWPIITADQDPEAQSAYHGPLPDMPMGGVSDIPIGRGRASRTPRWRRNRR